MLVKPPIGRRPPLRIRRLARPINLERSPMTVRSRPSRLFFAVAIVLMTAVFVFGQTYAQPDALDEDALELELELVQLHQRLEEIQQAALANNPQLEQQAQELGTLMVATMEEQGFQPQQSIDRIHEIQTALQSEQLPPEERMQLMEEAQTEYLMLEQAQAAAMEQPKVQEAHERFQEEVVEAMQQEDPATEEIIAEFTRKHEQYEEMHTAEQSASMLN